MTDANNTPEDGQAPDEGDVRRPGQGPEADASGPAPQGADDADGGDLLDEELQALLDGDAGEAEADPVSEADQLAAERLADLQRVTAEYANYRRRTEENRVAERERTTGDVLQAMLPVLDDLDRAEKHGDLGEDTAFGAIGQKLRGVVSRQGLVRFGEAGDEFDPNQHEAVFQQPTPGAERASVLEVVETGYRVGDTLVRAAKVVVAVPAE